jgi:hypothetical protein
MTKMPRVENNHPDYWTKLREAHRDIHELIESEAAFFTDSVFNDESVHREYDRMQAKRIANPLLARLRVSLSDGEINSRYI